ncbi:hypothetical protein F503_04262 [Ophiostoma piceae UAMH 11346]|uniref:Uncharacterized protein n=1 Tax=Ophiostoma piceae (strain UAMH 11346) TaxID=1262450 RepID=S3D5K2_OPHP1|nr:hypothetical protein F503_04262 [Ophiostoma piceae UAMH 11346]
MQSKDNSVSYVELGCLSSCRQLAQLLLPVFGGSFPDTLPVVFEFGIHVPRTNRACLELGLSANSINRRSHVTLELKLKLCIALPLSEHLEMPDASRTYLLLLHRIAHCVSPRTSPARHEHATHRHTLL